MKALTIMFATVGVIELAIHAIIQADIRILGITLIILCVIGLRK